MVSRTLAEEKYWEALRRFQSGQTRIVDINDSGFRISNLSVALEAGKVNPKGYIRPQRYPELCDAIKSAEVERQASTQPTVIKHKKTDTEKKKAITAKYNELKEAYDMLLEQYLNVVKENFELKAASIPKSVNRSKQPLP